MAKAETRLLVLLCVGSLVALIAGSIEKNWGLVIGGIGLGLVASGGPTIDWLMIGLKSRGPASGTARRDPDRFGRPPTSVNL